MNRRTARGISVCMAILMLCSTAMTALAEDKKETVYVLADAGGNVDSITVADRLINEDKRDRLEDVSTLGDIENVSGDETYTVENGVMVWDAGGHDIHYEGTADAPLGGMPAVPVAADSEIRPGKARILTTVDGGGPREYDAEILRVDLFAGQSRQLTIAITDPELLTATGGIVQGMSGSPILQDGKLVGAVTHVLLSDPSKGYGISMENMLAGIWGGSAAV